MTRKRQNLTILLSAFLAGVAFPGNNLGLLSLIAYVPFYFVLYQDDIFTKQRYKFYVGFKFGALYGLVAMYWIAYSQPAGFVATLVTIGVRHGLMTFLFLSMVKQKRFFWLIIPFQLVQEYFTMFTELDFAWHLAGYSLADFPLLIQTAEYFGVFGISAFIFIVNFLILRFYLYSKTELPAFPAIFQLTVFVLLFLITSVILYYNVNTNNVTSLKAGIVQPSIDAWEKWKPENKQLSIDRLTSGTMKAIDQGADLIVWPESAVPYPYMRYFTDLRNKTQALSDSLLLNFAIGSVDFRSDDASIYFNSAFHIFPNQRSLNVYHKQKLVPAAEKDVTPEFLKFLGELPGVGNYSRGYESKVFKSRFKSYPLQQTAEGWNVVTMSGMKDYQFSTIICIEANFPNLVSEMKVNGAQFVNIISNIGWFYPHFAWFKSLAREYEFSPFIESKAAYQNHQIAVMRAVENRISMVNGTNTGMSSIVDPLGRTIDPSPWYEEALIINYVPVLETGLTFYNRYGNFIVYLSMMIIVVVLMNIVSHKVRNKYA